MAFCALVTLLSAPTPVRAADAELRLELAVPSDATFFAHVRWPEDGPVRQRVRRSLEGLAEPEFLTSIAEHLAAVSVEGRRARLRDELDYWRRLLEQTDWSQLVSREFVVAGRLEVDRRAWLAAFRLPVAERDRVLAACRDFFCGLGAVLPTMELELATREGVETTCLYRLTNRAVEVCAGGYGDVVLLSTSRSFLRQAIQSLAGRTRDLSFVSGRPPRASVDRVARQSKFLASIFGRLESANGPATSGFAVVVEPSHIFADLVRDRPLLEDWSLLVLAADFREDGLSGGVSGDFSGGVEELRRVLHRASWERVRDEDLGAIVAREAPVFLPPTPPSDRESGTAAVALRGAARWLRGAAEAAGLAGAAWRLTESEDGGAPDDGKIHGLHCELRVDFTGRDATGPAREL